MRSKMKNPQLTLRVFICREEGIRTLDTLERYTHFPGVRLRPLGHLSNSNTNQLDPQEFQHVFAYFLCLFF